MVVHLMMMVSLCPIPIPILYALLHSTTSMRYIYLHCSIYPCAYTAVVLHSSLTPCLLKCCPSAFLIFISLASRRTVLLSFQIMFYLLLVLLAKLKIVVVEFITPLISLVTIILQYLFDIFISCVEKHCFVEVPMWIYFISFLFISGSCKMEARH